MTVTGDAPEEGVELDEHQRSLKAKFNSADTNGDGNLDLEEFGSFVHPQRHDHMVQHLIRDQLNTYDTDNNGEISRKEYLSKSAVLQHVGWCATCVTLCHTCYRPSCKHATYAQHAHHMSITIGPPQNPSTLMGSLRRTYLSGQRTKRLTLITTWTRTGMGA